VAIKLLDLKVIENTDDVQYCTHYYTSLPHVGNDYNCEPGTTDTFSHDAYFDPLRDRSGCTTSKFCENPTQPWLCRELNRTTTNDIKARICSIIRFSQGSKLINWSFIFSSCYSSDMY